MQFLLSIQEPSETHSSTLVEPVEEEEDSNERLDDPSQPTPSTSTATPSSRKITRSARDLNNIEVEIMQALKKPCMETSERPFFASFEEYISDMNETEKLQVHMGLLQSITEIKSRRPTLYVLNSNEIDGDLYE